MNARAQIVLWSALLAPPAGAVIIDRVAAAAGSEVVTLSEVRRQLRMDAMADGAPVDASPAALRAAAGRLIDQLLIRREIAISRYPTPAMAEADASIAQFIRERGLTQDQYQQLLARYDFTEDDVRAEALWRISVLHFVDFRFAPGIQVSDAEIQDYYSSEFLPAFSRKSPGQTPPPLDDVRDTIVRILTTRKTNAALDQWLVQMRATVKIRYFDAAFQTEAAAP